MAGEGDSAIRIISELTWHEGALLPIPHAPQEAPGNILRHRRPRQADEPVPHGRAAQPRFVLGLNRARECLCPLYGVGQHPQHHGALCRRPRPCRAVRHLLPDHRHRIYQAGLLVIGFIANLWVSVLAGRHDMASEAEPLRGVDLPGGIQAASGQA